MCTAHLGKDLKSHRTWRHEARCPSEERITNENFWPERHSYNKQHVEQKELPDDKNREKRESGEKGNELARNATNESK